MRRAWVPSVPRAILDSPARAESKLALDTFKNLTGEIKKYGNAMGPGARKWYQIDREGMSYHYR